MPFIHNFRIALRSSYLIPKLIWQNVPLNGPKKIQKSSTVFINNSQLHIHGVKLLTILAFLWPLKQKTQDDKKEAKTLRETDELFENGNYKHCYAMLCGLDDQDNVEVMWRKCRALYNMSTDPTSTEVERAEFVTEAFETIKEALNKNYQHFAVHKWFAILLDAKSKSDGIKERIKNLERVKMHMAKASELNPHDATTLYMLGEWCYQISDMPWYQRKIAATLFATPPNSTFHEALEFFSKAEKAEPKFYSMNLLMLGKTYLKLGEEDQAKVYLKAAASYPAKTNDDHRANKEAADLLKGLV